MISATVKPARAAETVARHIEGLSLEVSPASYALVMAERVPSARRRSVAFAHPHTP